MSLRRSCVQTRLLLANLPWARQDGLRRSCATSRTPDLCSAIAALSQLSYSPSSNAVILGRSLRAYGRDRIRTCDLYDVNVAL